MFSRAAPAPTAQPVETLEPRRLLSAAVAAQDVPPHATAPATAVFQPYKKQKQAPTSVAGSVSRGGTFFVAGTGGDDDVRVVQSGRYISAVVKGADDRLRVVFSARTKRVNFVSVVGNDGRDKIDCTGVHRSCAVDGGAGDDDVHGSLYLDDLYGGDGDDQLRGHDGVDFIDGGAGNDKVIGGANNDQLIGGPGADTILGGAGNDDLIASDGKANDYLSGGTGDDSCTADENSDYGPEWGDVWEIDPLIGDDIENIHR
jgi:Ca2+-binding RTX toxin-like protein